jgi:3-methyladenine DNA glycosylase AlkD
LTSSSRGGNASATARAQAFVAERLPQARGLGQALAELIDDPEAFVAVLRDGFAQLADPVYAAEQERVAPGTGAVFGVRWPLVHAVANQLTRPLAEGSSASALWLAQRLFDEQEHESRLFSHVCLRRSLPDDPERSWQLMRRLAAAAGDWIAVDSLADLYARGILADYRRWAELEQLVYAASRWERRLVGSTLATMPHRLPRADRSRLGHGPALTLIKSVIGDAEPDVQKSLSWALRSWYEVDPRATTDLLRAEAAIARRDDDGHRAWVVRDALTLPAVPQPLRLELRQQLEGIRRRPGAPSTSEASRAAAMFGDLRAATEQAVAAQGVRMTGRSAQ